MNKTRELKINGTLWATPSKLVNLLDFYPDKISIKTENHANDIKVHYVRYESDGFYLTIDDLDGYFDFSHNLGHLSYVVKRLLKLEFTASPIRDDKYILAELKIFKKKI